MASDGCLQKNGRHLDITSKDIDQLYNFSKALGRDFYIGQKSSGGGNSAYRIQFSDVAYYDFLIACGLTPVKSKTLNKLQIPDQFYADFLRGVFDGDGTTYGYRDPRWRSSFMFYISFASASPAFISFLQATNMRLLKGLSPGSISNVKGAQALSYAKADSHVLYKFMYYDDQVICLNRKFTKLKGFVEKDLNWYNNFLISPSGEIW